MTAISTELKDQIAREAEAYLKQTTSTSLKDAYEAGAANYAHYKEQFEDLERWKREAILVLDPLMEYGWSKEAQIPLGKSITEAILQRAKQFLEAKKALEGMTTDLKKKIKGVGGLLPQVEDRRTQAAKNEDWIEEKECSVLLTVWETNVRQWTETLNIIENLLSSWKEEGKGEESL